MMPSYTPPATVANNARMALEVRASKPPSERGMTSIGIARASQLSRRQPVSIETIQRMVSYFDRHEVDKEGATWSEQGKGWQAWMGWGGDEGRTWANQILKEYNMSETKEAYKVSRRHSEADMKLIRDARRKAIDIAKSMFDLGDDGDDAMVMDEEPKSVKAIEIGAEFNTRQRMLVSSLVEVTHEAGKFDWGVGANGAHYMPAAQNPFATQGIACEHCYFYQPTTTEGYGQCAIVEGMVEEYAVCKFWVIPEATIVMETMEAEVEPAMIEETDMEVAALADRNTTPAQREEMPASDFVIPETRNFPVVTPTDIPAAVSSWGRYRGDVSFEEFKQRLIALAKRKGENFVAQLPESWKAEMAGGVQKALDNTATMEVSDAAKALARRLLGRN
jgi:hypothetical protein